MSWAALARKAATVNEPECHDDTQRVIATANAAKLSKARLQNVDGLNTQTHNLPDAKKGLMVLDTNAFINGFENYFSTADVFVTTPQVLQECKDSKTRELLEALPIGLTVLDPTKEAVAVVTDMADKTGDLGTLSRTDIRLCALAYDCAQQLNKLTARIEPCGTKINPSDGIVVNDELHSDGDADEDAESAGAPTDFIDATSAAIGVNDPAPHQSNTDDCTNSWGAATEEGREPESKKPKVELPGWGGNGAGDDDDDGFGEWVTPENIKAFKSEFEGKQSKYAGGFACATSDFPMQNVMLHLGIAVVGPRGMLINELRQWLLRCHACYTLVNDTTRLFCPSCGSGDTLKRVAYNVNALTGERTLFINFKFHISTRGTKYTLPKPRGGRNGTNKCLVLREDQLLRCGRNTSSQKKKIVADDDLGCFGSDVKQKRVRRDPNQQRVTSSYQKYNVNEKRKAMAARRK